MDKRNEKLAQLLVNYSCGVKPKQNVLVKVRDVDEDFTKALIREVYRTGAYPFVQVSSSAISREIYLGQTEEQVKRRAEYDLKLIQNMNASISVCGTKNIFEMSDVPFEKIKAYDLIYGKPLIQDILCKNNWVLLNYPSSAYAQQAGMTTEEFENFFFDVCTLDYEKMSRAMDPLVALMNKTDKVRVVSKGTDISFSIKGIPAIKCAGKNNIPDGEVFTAPVKDSVNGFIQYNIPTIENNTKFENVRLVVQNGKIIEATCSGNTEKLNDILDTDEGARYFGEFSLGVNPYITRPMLDILFDEKICGSIHFTPGMAYDEAPNGNDSAVHWDMVLCQMPEYGGGEIYFDDKLIRKDGRFVIKELFGLNPENLK